MGGRVNGRLWDGMGWDGIDGSDGLIDGWSAGWMEYDKAAN